jgi:sugar lactone lactonase YvrE
MTKKSNNLALTAALVVLATACAGAKTATDAPPNDSAPQVDALMLPGQSFYPESLGVSSDGTFYVGSVTTGAVAKFLPGQADSSSFLPAQGDLKGVTGVLLDEESGSLFVCAVDVSFGSVPSVQRYDLKTGKLVATFAFPAAADGKPNPYFGFPNDMTFDGNHRLYVTDSIGGKVYTVADAEHDSTLTLWASDPELAPTQPKAFGANGISWDGAGAMYVNNNDTGALVRIPLKSDGTAGATEPVSVTPPLAHPDGQRQLDASTLIVADNAGALKKLTISGNTATATDVGAELNGPTSVAIYGGSYWVTEGQITTSLLTGKPPQLPFAVRRVAAK